ncbi:hypothetical protein BGX29_011885 [Mortierella sp. GBA35]|nr:hypothetical protein BGX29_011885 [Mortierella sp. GBA35]
MSLQTQKWLVRRNPGLEFLEWEGPWEHYLRFQWSTERDIHVRLNARDFETLDNLQTLRLLNWDGSNGSLVKVLRTVARTLKRLEIGPIPGFKESDIDTPPQAHGDAECGGNGNGATGGSRLTLPNVRVFRTLCSPEHPHIVHLAGCCPNLQKFDAGILMTDFDLCPLANNLRIIARTSAF